MSETSVMEPSGSTKAFVPKTVADLLQYEKFPGLPIDEKIDLIRSLGKQDQEYRKLDDKTRIRLFQKLIPTSELPKPASEDIPDATASALSPVQALIGAFRGTQRLPFQAGEPAQGGDPTALAEHAVQTSAPGRAMTSAISGAAGTPGDIINIPGSVSTFLGGPDFRLPIGSHDLAKHMGLDPLTMNALERSIQTISGAVSPGLFLQAARSAGILPGVAQTLYRFMSGGVKADIAAGGGAAAGAESGRFIAPESSIAPVVSGLGGALATVGVPYAIARGRTSPAIRKYSMGEQETRVTQKATEAFGGPPLQEQLAGGTTTQTTQQQALEGFVETQKLPVFKAQASTQMAEQLSAGQKQRGRILRSDLIQRLRTSDDTAMAALDRSKQQLNAVESRIAAEKETARQAVRYTQEEGYQLSEDVLQQRKTAQSTADTNIATLEQQRVQIMQEMKDSIKRAETERTNVQVGARTQTQQTRQSLTSLEDDIARVTAANEKDMNDYLVFAQRYTEKLAPEMAGTRTPETRAQTGRATLQVAGKSGQTISENVVTRLRDNAAAKYEVLHLNYGIEEEAGTLNAIVAKYKPALIGEDVVPSVVTEEVRGSYAPGRAIRDYETRVLQIAEDVKVQQNLVDAPDLDTVVLSLKDMQNFRSRLMDDLRHTPPSSQNFVPLKQLYAEVNEYFWGLGRTYPEAFDELRTINHWYDTEVHRLMGDAPFAFANVTNPLTRERLHTPDEVARAYFGIGPGVATGTRGAAQNEQRFLRYIDDLDSVIASVHLNKDQFYLSPTGYKATTNVEMSLADAANARNAKERLFDAVRVQFYDAVTDASGKYVPAEAAKWLKQHASLIDGNTELAGIFQTPRNQANAIRDVRAKAQGLLALPETYVQGMRDALRVTQAEGGEAVFQARLAARQKESQARLTAEQAQVSVESGIAREQESLTDIRQRLADKLRVQHREQQLARFEREDIQARTTSEMAQTKRIAEQERTDITKTQRTERRSLADERALQTARERQASEALARSQDAEKQALNTYNRTFGGRNAAEHAILESTAARTLGTTPEDIVAQIETMNPSDRNFAYAQWMKKTEMGEPEKAALLQAMWRSFLGPDTVPDPQKAAAFINDLHRQRLLRTYYPDYLDNITRVQRAFTALDTLAKDAPTAFTKQNIGVHAGVTGTAFALAKILGFGWDTAAVLGFTTELGLQATSRALHMRRIGALNQIYLNASDAAVIANALRQRNAAGLANQSALFVLTRAGIAGREYEVTPE